MAKVVVKEYKDTQHLQSGKPPISSRTHQSQSKKQSNKQSNNQSNAQTNNPQSGKQTNVNVKRSAGRPKESHPFRSFKNAATGDTRNSPFTDPNIIFLVGGSLIIASQWTRIKKTFGYAWNVNKIVADGPSVFYNDIKVIGVQVLFIFILTITGRAIPALARIWLVILGGLWILWLMRNPEILKLLQVASQ